MTMTTSFEETMNELKAEYEKAMKNLEEMQDTITGATGKARSKTRMISAVVDGRGELTELKFHNQAWRRMPPGELSKVIMQTITEAREAAQRQMWSKSKELAPNGLDFSEMLTGRAKWTEEFSRAPALPRVVQEILDRLPAEQSSGEGKT
jgi:DNA-binding protein YbaB